MSGELDSIIERLAALDPEAQAEIGDLAAAATKNMLWVPNPGPQTRAWESEADELFYGGEAGGGKSDLVCGLALGPHQESLILRRFGDDAAELAERTMDILGTREGFNGQKLKIRRKDRTIDFSGCKEESDKQRHKGVPHDLICFDEIGDFLESQYRFIIGWNRSANQDQRCRVVCTGNPPTTAEGLWVISYWGAWLDPSHPNPAANGELRWYTTINGKDQEVNGPGPHQIEGEPEPVMARSRTFIRARLSDNPDLDRTNYASVLAAMPEGYREAYRDGKFDAGLKDKPFQVIPTAWVRAAQERWEKNPPFGIPMCAMGVDVAQGGDDRSVIARRHDGWFAKNVKIPGVETPDGPSVAGRVLALRRHNAEVVVDMGGGYGGSTYDHLKQNEISCHAYKGANKSRKRTKDKAKLKFFNKRAEVFWRMREALDPGQYQGSPISLPPGQELLADLTAPTFELTANGIKIMPKEKVVKLLGRSPDEGDAVLMCWSAGPTAATHITEWRKDQINGTVGASRKHQPVVNFGRPRRRR